VREAFPRWERNIRRSKTWLQCFDEVERIGIWELSAILMPDDAIAQIRQVFGHARRDPSAEVRVVQEAVGIEGSKSVFRRIEKANSVDDVFDCTMEIRYARIFDSRGFQVKFVPPGATATPDLFVSSGVDSAYVEIKRIRPDGRSLPASTHTLGFLPEQYGGEEDTRKVEQTLREAFRQVLAVPGSNSIIATWSDRGFVEEIDFEQAVRYILKSPADRNDGRPIPGGLLFCMFGQFWEGFGQAGGQQIYCEPLRILREPFLTWVAELQQARV